MYALKARDKLHKKEKDAYEERRRPRSGGAEAKQQKRDKHHRVVPAAVTVNREAKVRLC